MSVFGGPSDKGVSDHEGLALIEDRDLNTGWFYTLFLPSSIGGLARRLDPDRYYIAMRWDYHLTSREYLRHCYITVIANGVTITNVRPVDWGPASHTGRIADLSPGLAKTLHLETDDICTVIVRLPS